jgi:hypothetical protein
LEIKDLKKPKNLFSMRNKQLIFNIKFVLIALFLMLGCELRKVEDLQPISFPSIAEVFIDDFTGDLAYAAFGGSDVTAFQVDRQVSYNNTRQSMRFNVPDDNSPNGSYAGGVFFSRTGRNLSGYNALTFYIKASQSVTIGEIGFGNDLGENKYLVKLGGLSANTNWKKVIIPIPDALKLVAEKGLLYYAAAPIDKKGFTFWIDEVRFEKLGDLGNLQGLIYNGEDKVLSKAETGDKITINGIQTSVTLPTGVNQIVDVSPHYFTFMSSNPGIASAANRGLVSVNDAGTTTITAKLGEATAKGSLKITSTGAPVGPTTKAPTPTRDAADVISLFSNAYPNVPVDSWNMRYRFSTVDEFFIKVQEDDVIRYRNLNFVGIEFRNPLINASSMGGIHLDIWTPDPTDLPNNFKVLLTDLGPNGAFGGEDDKTHEVTITSPTLASNNWVGIDIPFSAFTGLTSRSRLGQMVLSGSIPNMYIDNVYFYKIPTKPTTAAPTPTKLAANVISIFSDAYTNVAGSDLKPYWGQQPQANWSVTETPIAGNNTLHYANFNYQGLQIGSPQNVSSYGFLHLDYYSVNATALNVFLISSVPGAEKAFSLPVPTTGWNSVDIPLSTFTPTVNLNDVIQFKFDGGTGASDIYLDNIYFWKNPAPPVVPTVAAPVPTRPAAEVLSIFSDSYTNIAGTDFFPFWGQNPPVVVSQTPIQGNTTMRYANFSYQGIQIGSVQDVSSYGSLHLDYYSTNATSLRVFLISPPNETSFTLNVPTTGWNSVDIPLTAFAGVNLSQVLQFKFDGGTGTSDIFLDNIYFFKGGGGSGSCPAPPAGEFITDGGFEANAGCWELIAIQGGTSSAIVTNVNNGGSNSARIKTAQGGNPGIKQTRFGVGNILPNTTYQVKFDIRADASDPVANGAVLKAAAFSEASESSGTGAIRHELIAGEGNVSSTWTTKTINFTTPNNAANVAGGLSLLIELIGGGPTTTGTIYIDNVSLKKQ